MIYSAADIAKWGSCPQGVAFAEKYAPNGFTIAEFLALKEAPNEYIHWVFERINPTDEEWNAYIEKMSIVNTTNYYYVNDVEDCRFVVKSHHLKNCQNIFESKYVENSQDIVDCEEVTDSSLIFAAALIHNSHKVSRGSNITNGHNIYNSIMIVNSRNIYESSDVINSSEIIKSKNVSDSKFCRNCTNIKHCMFCDGIEDKEYYVFNQPVSKEKFDLLFAQYQKYMDADLQFIDEWPENLAMGLVLRASLNYAKWYAPISSRFWKWTRTLPGYDEMFLYNMTMLPEILVD